MKRWADRPRLLIIITNSTTGVVLVKSCGSIVPLAKVSCDIIGAM